MKAKTIKRFFDREFDDYREIDDEFQVGKDRLAVLVYAGVAKLIEEIQAEKPKIETKKMAQ